MLSQLLPDYMRINLTPHFYEDEFPCPCPRCEGELSKMDLHFMEMLEFARDAANRPFIISEGGGYRCSEYQKELKSTTRTSSHEKGMAADIAVEYSGNRYIIITSLLGAGFNRIGIYDRHIHVDNDPDKPSGVIWVGESK